MSRRISRRHKDLSIAWEIEIKHGIGKPEVSSEVFMSDCKAMGFKALGIQFDKHHNNMNRR